MFHEDIQCNDNNVVIIVGDNDTVVYLEEVPMHALGDFKGRTSCWRYTIHCTMLCIDQSDCSI